jgi:hypothetical protein
MNCWLYLLAGEDKRKFAIRKKGQEGFQLTTKDT